MPSDAGNKPPQRRPPRLEVSPKAEIHDGSQRYKALIQDLNDQGLAFVCSRSWAAGKLLDLTVYLPQGIVTAEIEVRHSNDSGTGALFTFMDSISRATYDRFVDEFSRAGRGSWLRPENP